MEHHDQENRAPNELVPTFTDVPPMPLVLLNVLLKTQVVSQHLCLGTRKLNTSPQTMMNMVMTTPWKRIMRCQLAHKLLTLLSWTSDGKVDETESKDDTS